MVAARIRIVVPLLAAVLAVGWLTTESLCDESLESKSAQVDRLFQAWNQPDSPGFAVGVVYRGRFVHARGYGMANLDERSPITIDTPFEVFSFAKSFTSACIARLIDEATISPDDDVRKFIPELPVREDPIRVRHLIQCKSGLRDYFFLITLIGRNHNDVWASADVLDLIARQKSSPFVPGEEFSYSNSDYFLLGLIVQRVTGKSLREYADEQLFRPLGMKETFFDDDQDIPLPHRAIGYGRNPDGRFHRLMMNSSTVGPWGLKTTVRDLSRWDSNYTDSKLASGKQLDAFFQIGSLLGNENCLSAYSKQKYKGLRRFWYTGGGPGYLTTFVTFPDQQFAIILLTNFDDDRGTHWHHMTESAKQIADIYLAEETQDQDSTKPVWKDDLPVATLASQELESKAGYYQRAGGDFVRLSVADDTLQLTPIMRAFHPHESEDLTPLGIRHFRSKSHHVPFDLTFNVDKDNRIDGVQIEYQDGYRTQWTPVTFVSLDEQQLAEYSGDYECEDLGSVYRFTVSDGALQVQFNYARPRRLLSATQDLFIPNNGELHNMTYRFERDSSDQLTGFVLGFGRAQGLKFIKRR